MLRKVVPAEVQNAGLGDHEVEIRMSTGALGRDGHVLVPQGAELGNYRANPIILWQHDPGAPVGRAAAVAADADAITARVMFAPAGVSAKADEIRGLVKSGIINAVSVGFDPIDGEPLDPKRPRGGQRFTRWELLECSFVSVPADPGAQVTAREQTGAPMADWKCGAARDLPIEDSDAWDGAAAEKSIFEHAGAKGEKDGDFDPAKARKGFLAYDADNPHERGGYKLPIAHAVDGELKVPKGAIRAVASRLSGTDIPDEAKRSAGAVLDHYKEKAGIGDADGAAGKDGKKAAPGKKTRGERRAAPALKVRGMYELGRLAYLFDALCNAQACSQLEESLENDDDSALPAALAAVLQDLGAALVAMAVEEVAEMCGASDDDAGAMGLGEPGAAEVSMQMAGKPRLARFRLGYQAAQQREGRVLSDESMRCLREAMDAHDEGMAMHRAAIRCHTRAAKMVNDLMDRAAVPGDGSGDENDSQQVQTSEGAGQSTGSEGGRALLSYDQRQAELRQFDVVGLTQRAA